jgi:hypothetical protein
MFCTRALGARSSSTENENICGCRIILDSNKRVCSKLIIVADNNPDIPLKIIMGDET